MDYWYIHPLFTMFNAGDMVIYLDFDARICIVT